MKTLDHKRLGQEAKRLGTFMKRNLIDQDEAIRVIIEIYQSHMVGFAEKNHPIGNFLFLGPTGSGKTRTAELAAEGIMGNHKALIKIDCAEFAMAHEIAKLIGSPPGYLGHRETHPMLSQEVLNQYHTKEKKMSFVLFDEIEKSSDTLWNLLLGILDKATLTLGDNRRVDFSQTMIFMTSNLGAKEIGSLLEQKMGFNTNHVEEINDIAEKMNTSAINAAKRKFTPEFINRVDKIVTFRPLGRDSLHQILDINLHDLVQRIRMSSPAKAFHLKIHEKTKEFLLNQCDLKYGARDLKRVLEREIVAPLSNLVASEQVAWRDLVEVILINGEISFVKTAENIPFSNTNVELESSGINKTKTSAAGR